MSVQDKVYTVLGGSNPGVVSHFRTESHAIMPIIIKCTSAAEANAALGLQPIFKQLNCDKVDENPEAFARAVAGSSQITDLFATNGPFYAVYDGLTERAIYVRNFGDVQLQIQNYQDAKYKAFDTIKHALVYMLLKGNQEQMEKLTFDGKGPSVSTWRKSKKIHSHIRDFTGIIDTVYGTTSTALDYALYDIGTHASRYLQAHGYTEATIEDIEQFWSMSKNVDEFVDHLVPCGMAATEVQWLWDLIRHPDDCAF
ncbi:hypothetical protein C8R43DRAFT_966011 [Mycena crocata]|nr:hypothetical protein C8R43DRAFT_966164 [Mycena crocata]KAJ7078371.1 hypothetical protein C8R43DRAFT_966011 [Mycena crocata]